MYDSEEIACNVCSWLFRVDEIKKCTECNELTCEDCITDDILDVCDVCFCRREGIR